jgi:Uncharacterized conserved protein
MVDFMKALPSKLRLPKAILTISAHWEEEVATVLGAERPPMLYDYYGFPPESYEFKYPAPGSPELAERVSDCLGRAGLASRVDPSRGFDHGSFVPLMLMYPEADIPCLQLSLLSSLDPGEHLALGRALRDLADQDILVIGSGFSFHNMRAFDWSGERRKDERNDAFQDWLVETCCGPRSQDEREQRLSAWEGAPSARYCHPREEHLLPLQVCVGLAGEPAELAFDDYIVGKRAVAFLWR